MRLARVGGTARDNSSKGRKGGGCVGGREIWEGFWWLCVVYGCDWSKWMRRMKMVDVLNKQYHDDKIPPDKPSLPFLT